MKKIIPVIFACATFVLSHSALADSNHYTVLIDAGSSSSKVHVFQYDDSSAMPVVNDLFSESAKPGLSSFADHPENAGQSLKKAVDDATQFLQNRGADLSATDISVLGTAGMRLLSDDQQQAIYASVKQYLAANYAYPVKFFKTISGQKEALFGWLDVNYLLGNFQQNQTTVGSIDMGGASTQIAYISSNPQDPNNIQIKINNNTYTVFAKSFLGLGQDQARAAMTSDQAASSCYPQNYVFNKTAQGNFNMNGCGAIYSAILQKANVAQQIIPFNGQSFYAYSGIYFTYNFFNTDKTPDQASLESHIQGVCNETWAQLQKDYPNVDAKYLSSDCANAVYNDQLIYSAYKLVGSQLVVVSQINQTGIDWTLGAVLYGVVHHD